MKTLIIIFICISLYGSYVENYRGAVIFALIALLTAHARDVFIQRDKDWLKHPSSAQVPDMPTRDLLRAQDTEAS